VYNAVNTLVKNERECAMFWFVELRCTYQTGQKQKTVIRKFLVQTRECVEGVDSDIVAVADEAETTAIKKARETADFGIKWLGYELKSAHKTDVPFEIK
jgi:hypothetical protein